MRPSHCIAVLALLCATPAEAGKAVIRGTLRLPGDGVRVVSIGPAAPIRGVTDAIPEKFERKLACERRDTTVMQVRQRFVPQVLPVVVGTTVSFENADRVYHNIFSVSASKRFDVGKYAPGQSRQVKFDKPGVVRLFCDIHPDETGYVLVTPNHAYLRPDAAGSFAFPKLPRGKYTLTMWHPRFGRKTRTVEIPKRGDLTLNLHF